MSLFIEEGKLYQPIEHIPEYAGVPALQPCIERWNMIEPWLQLNPGLVLDLGCHTGWFCRQFARQGWLAVGVDQSEAAIEIARRDTTRPLALYVCGDVLDYQLNEMPWDVVLLLSIAMYLFDDVERGWNVMCRISEASPQLFMDFGGQYAGHRLPFDESSAIGAMLAHTCYTSGQLLGHTDFESRPLFRFSR